MKAALTMLLASWSLLAGQDQWQPLWNGKNLEGWHVIGKREWKIENGELVGRNRTKDPMFGHLVTDATYQDFQIRVTFKAVKGNSGLYFRIEEKGYSGVSGFQAEIAPVNDVGGLYETNGRAWVAKTPPDLLKKCFKPGDWNTMIVSAQGSKIRVELNGQETAAINDPKGRRRGKIALQVHGGEEVEVRFKEVAIKGKPVAD